jgi:RNA polymerase sigma-70 factor (ECF subfamily)
MDMDRDADRFEKERPYLTGIAYRMLGALSEAQDVVQDAYLRWHRVANDEIDNPRAYLAKVVTRICLDRLKSARMRRETYVGPWLPEPLLESEDLLVQPDESLAETLSVAFLLALERLSPLERAAFLLHDVFDMEFGEVAAVLDRTETSCRQLASRARMHVKEAKPRFSVSAERGAQLADAFLTALGRGDLAALTALLAEDAVLKSDGGGKVLAALYPIEGNDKIARFLVGIGQKAGGLNLVGRPARINGLPGFVVFLDDELIQTFAFETDETKIRAIYVVRNPEKLAHIGLH